MRIISECTMHDFRASAPPTQATIRSIHGRVTDYSVFTLSVCKRGACSPRVLPVAGVSQCCVDLSEVSFATPCVLRCTYDFLLLPAACEPLKFKMVFPDVLGTCPCCRFATPRLQERIFDHAETH